MTTPARPGGAASEASTGPTTRGRLLRKYVALLMAVVSLALIANSLLDIWFTYHEQKALLARIQRGQAEAGAQRISQFVGEIEGQMAWATQLPWSPDTLDEWRFDAVRLLRQVPAVTEVAQLDEFGREQARMSRNSMDVVGSEADYSKNPAFLEAIANKVYHGPVYFVRESEPYMTLAMVGARREYGVIVAEVNLKFIWDVVSQIKVGDRGQAFVVDKDARLIAHPDISLVLRNTDFSRLAYVQAARAAPLNTSDDHSIGTDIQDHRVLNAHALVAPLGWLVFVQLPIEEAFAPIYASILRSGTLVLAALMLAFFGGLFLASRMVVPIRTLRDGAARLGSGDLAQRISIKTGDELEALGDQFNSMAAQLQDSYATLERKVEERTQQLELANLAKSRFLAAASHDLRQPLHALGLFVAQLRARMSAEERKRVVERVDAALSAMNELFNALLDISKLDSGTMAPNKTEFPVERLLKRIESTFGGEAREKGLQLRVVPSEAWVRSDFILLERIVFNLVQNAIRYTSRGGVVVGCRSREGALRFEVWDTGAGIPPDERQNIFGEFYRLGEPDRDRRSGLGLGLAFVDRLCRLLEHPIELTSVVGKGSRFAVVVPLVAARVEVAEQPVSIRAPFDLSSGKLIVVIDDDPLVLDGMGGLFRSWGCRVVTGHSDGAALTGLAEHEDPPDLIISDYRLPDGTTGIQVIERLRSAFCTQIPAFLISGDTNIEPLRDARAKGLHLLHKPVDAMTLRAMLNQILRKAETAGVQ